MLQQLSPEVQSLLRSGVAITSVAQCVEELVLNSIDASATCIAIRVDMSCCKVQVVDNGTGIPKVSLEKITERYTTSKCHSLKDLDTQLQHFGYRGEALASLKDISAILEIESRAKQCAESFTRTFQQGHPHPVKGAKNHRPCSGTTVTVHDLFYNLPVRRKSMNESLELERIRQRIEAIALIHPTTSFSLRNDVTSTKVLQTHKSNSVLGAFTFLFGAAKSRIMGHVSKQAGTVKINGFIGREGTHNKALQFIFINDRLVLKTRIHKLINYHLSKSSITRRRHGGGGGEGSPSFLSQNSNMSPSKSTSSERHGIFVINITCPLSDYDITFDPAKTLIEFKDWQAIVSMVGDLVGKFLIEHNLVVKLDAKDELCSESQEVENPIEADSQEDGSGDRGSVAVLQRYAAGISTVHTCNNLASETVSRPRTVNPDRIVEEIMAEKDKEETEESRESEGPDESQCQISGNCLKEASEGKAVCALSHDESPGQHIGCRKPVCSVSPLACMRDTSEEAETCKEVLKKDSVVLGWETDCSVVASRVQSPQTPNESVDLNGNSRSLTLTIGSSPSPGASPTEIENPIPRTRDKTFISMSSDASIDTEPATNATSSSPERPLAILKQKVQSMNSQNKFIQSSVASSSLDNFKCAVNLANQNLIPVQSVKLIQLIQFANKSPSSANGNLSKSTISLGSQNDFGSCLSTFRERFKPLASLTQLPISQKVNCSEKLSLESGTQSQDLLGGFAKIRQLLAVSNKDKRTFSVTDFESPRTSTTQFQRETPVPKPGETSMCKGLNDSNINISKTDLPPRTPSGLQQNLQENQYQKSTIDQDENTQSELGATSSMQDVNKIVDNYPCQDYPSMSNSSAVIVSSSLPALTRSIVFGSKITPIEHSNICLDSQSGCMACLSSFQESFKPLISYKGVSVLETNISRKESTFKLLEKAKQPHDVLGDFARIKKALAIPEKNASCDSHIQEEANKCETPKLSTKLSAQQCNKPAFIVTTVLDTTNSNPLKHKQHCSMSNECSEEETQENTKLTNEKERSASNKGIINEHVPTRLETNIGGETSRASHLRLSKEADTSRNPKLFSKTHDAVTGTSWTEMISDKKNCGSVPPNLESNIGDATSKVSHQGPSKVPIMHISSSRNPELFSKACDTLTVTSWTKNKNDHASHSSEKNRQSRVILGSKHQEQKETIAYAQIAYPISGNGRKRQSSASTSTEVLPLATKLSRLSRGEKATFPPLPRVAPVFSMMDQMVEATQAALKSSRPECCIFQRKTGQIETHQVDSQGTIQRDPTCSVNQSMEKLKRQQRNYENRQLVPSNLAKAIDKSSCVASFHSAVRPAVVDDLINRSSKEAPQLDLWKACQDVKEELFRGKFKRPHEFNPPPTMAASAINLSASEANRKTDAAVGSGENTDSGIKKSKVELMLETQELNDGPEIEKEGQEMEAPSTVQAFCGDPENKAIKAAKSVANLTEEENHSIALRQACHLDAVKRTTDFQTASMTETTEESANVCSIQGKAGDDFSVGSFQFKAKRSMDFSSAENEGNSHRVPYANTPGVELSTSIAMAIQTLDCTLELDPRCDMAIPDSELSSSQSQSEKSNIIQENQPEIRLQNQSPDNDKSRKVDFAPSQWFAISTTSQNERVEQLNGDSAMVQGEPSEDKSQGFLSVNESQGYTYKAETQSFRPDLSDKLSKENIVEQNSSPAEAEHSMLQEKSANENVGAELNKEPVSTQLKSPHKTLFVGPSWICQLDTNTGRKIFVNKITGNSSYSSPQFCSAEDEAQRTVIRVKNPVLPAGANPLLQTDSDSVKARPRALRGPGPALLAVTAAPGSDTHLSAALVGHLEHQAREDATERGIKWRHGVVPTGGEHGSEELQSVKTMLEEWENPIFTPPEQCGVRVDGSNNVKGASRVQQAIHPYKFTRELLSTVKVLGQVDNKFIACLLTLPPGGDGAPHKLLSMIDQHAAHERVRLEQLTAEAYSPDGVCISRHDLDPAVKVTLLEEQVRVATAYRPALDRKGIAFRVDGAQRTLLLVHRVPACLAQKEATERKRRRPPDTAHLLQTLLIEETELLESTHGASSTIPGAVFRILCSQACHGAVKFGDPLVPGACEQLVQQLATCRLPFQCAHGRPSVQPIVDMNLLGHHVQPQKPKVKLWKLHKK